MTHKRMRMILNGKSAANPAVRDAIHQIRERGYVLEVRPTWEGGDAARLAVEALDEGLDTLIAAGGDGTVNEVVNGLMNANDHPEIAFGILPLGTANDFATGCGIPTDDPFAALLLAAEGQPTRVDVGKANERFFLNVASGGFGAEVTTKTPKDMKKVLGGAAYSLVGAVMAAKMTPYRGKIAIDGESAHHGSVILMSIANGRLAGGGYSVAPNALINDGLFDVLGVRDVETSEFGTLLNEIMHLEDEGNQYVFYRQLSECTIQMMDWFQFNLDGEPLQGTSFHFRVLPERLALILPSDAPVLKT